MILHLLPAATWQALGDADSYGPASLEEEGFVHCSGDDDVMLDVANRFYADAGALLVLSIDEHDLEAEVRWEAPAPTPPNWDGPLFPHVYGPINLDAVIAIRRLVRDGGRFVGYAPVSD